MYFAVNALLFASGLQWKYNLSFSSFVIPVYKTVLLLLVNQSMDFYREGMLSNRWEEGLPLHLCDFSTIAIILYFITQNRNFFVFAFFFGIAGGGMSILTPDTIYGFPNIGYIQSQIGLMKKQVNLVVYTWQMDTHNWG